MTIKQYQAIKLGFVVILAVVFSQSIIFENFLIPIALLIVSSLILLLLRKRVKGVLADERDYLTGGKAALLAIQIYSWIAVMAMFILYAFRDVNPAYEPIGLTLAYSTCVLMLFYAVIFRYYNKVKLGDKKLLFSVFVLALFLALIVFSLRLFSGEDNWICQDGQWIEHGHPDFPAPDKECQ
ncbi:MAG: DUF2178 domain-containing protein [Patescibacteria group bacterium]|jgi:uncharacterized membrane protein